MFPVRPDDIAALIAMVFMWPIIFGTAAFGIKRLTGSEGLWPDLKDGLKMAGFACVFMIGLLSLFYGLFTLAMSLLKN